MSHHDEPNTDILADQAQKITRRKRIYSRIKVRGLEIEDVGAEAVRLFLTAVAKGNYRPVEHSHNTQEAYLTGIVENVINNMTKRRMTRLKHENTADLAGDLVDHRLMPVEVLDAKELEKAVDKILAILNQDVDRSIIEQFLQLRKPTLRKTADKLGMAPATVRQRFKRMKKKVLETYGSLRTLMMN